MRTGHRSYKAVFVFSLFYFRKSSRSSTSYTKRTGGMDIAVMEKNPLSPFRIKGCCVFNFFDSVVVAAAAGWYVREKV